ncbi:hypothetical protein RZS08_67410, partial [Arthrospira platensis SPKY1]|nr:hypothetical protein [Arthrospira platensis SPKY1]
QELNIKVGDKAPNVYFRKVLEQVQDGGYLYGALHSEAELLENLNMNSIPTEIMDMDINHYEDFLTHRRALMAKKINQYYHSL